MVTMIPVPVTLAQREATLELVLRRIRSGVNSMMTTLYDAERAVLECSVFSHTADAVLEYEFALDPSLGLETERGKLEDELYAAEREHEDGVHARAVERYLKKNRDSQQFRYLWPEEESVSEVHDSLESLREAWPGVGAVLQSRTIGQWQRQGEGE